MGLEVISIKARILRSDRAVINTYPQNHQKSYSSCFSLALLPCHTFAMRNLSCSSMASFSLFCATLFLCAILLCMQTKSSSCMSFLLQLMLPYAKRNGGYTGFTISPRRIVQKLLKHRIESTAFPLLCRGFFEG